MRYELKEEDCGLVSGHGAEVHEIPGESNDQRDKHDAANPKCQPESTSRSNAGGLSHNASMAMFPC
jgi:hypothetical protein